jgi:fimbrial isopeptide formation D2 family protein
VSWDLGTLAAGAGGSVKFWAFPSAAGSYTNTATIDSPDAASAEDSATTQLGTLTPSKVTTTPTITDHGPGGSQATYVLTIVNDAGSTANNVTITDTMEKGFTYNSTTSVTLNGTPTTITEPSLGDNPAVWSLSSLAAGDTLVITFVADISDVVGPGTYQNDVGASSDNISDVDFDPLSTTDEDVTIDNWIGPNHVVVSWIEAVEEKGSVVVRWETDAEVDTVGFYVKRLNDDTEEYEPIHEKLLPALVAAPQGGIYRVEDPTAPVGTVLTYILVEVERSGVENTYGPFTLEITGGKGYLSLRSRNARRRSFSAEPRVRQPRVSRRDRQGTVRGWARRIQPPDGLRIAVRENGLYQVTAEEISQTLGIGLRDAHYLIRSHQIDLRLDGRSIPWLSRGSALLFYGEDIDSMYTRDRIYHLGWGRGETMSGFFGGGADSVAGQTFEDTLRFEEDYYPLVIGNLESDVEFWFWDYVLADNGRAAFMLDVAGVAPGGGARLTVHLQGGLDWGTGVHHAQVFVNGKAVGEGRVRDYGKAAFTCDLEPGLLKEGENIVEVDGILDPGVPRSLFFVDKFELAYERRYMASEGRLIARNEGYQLLTIGGYGEPDVVLLDISNARDPKLVVEARVERSLKGDYQVSFEPKNANGRYLAFAASSVRAPAFLEVDHITNWLDPANGADYLVIAPAELAPAAERLASYRETQGLDSMVVELNDIMDELNSGVFNPHVIRELYASDNRLADVVGEDGLPEMAIGRIPVETVEQLDAYIDKIIAYETSGYGGWTDEVLWVTDDPDSTGDYTADGERLAGWVPENLQVNRVQLSEMSPQEAFESIVENMNRGVFLMTYLGHAGTTQLAHEGILKSDDMPYLVNAERLPFALLMACHLGNFALPGYPSLAEDLVVHEEGGAAAVWSPVGISYNPQRVVVAEAFLRVFFEQRVDVLGDAILEALASAANTAAGKREILDTQVLIGDPALGLKVAGSKNR